MYILNRDSATNLTISSPLEVHRSCALIHDIIGLDVGFENPVFANIEVDYSEADQDPTGEAFNNTQKVVSIWLSFFPLSFSKTGVFSILHTTNWTLD